MSRRTNTINNSSSKQQYVFGKESRFPQHSSNTNVLHYDLQGTFGHKRGSNVGRGFSTSQARFYTSKSNSPNKIDGPGIYDRQGNTFGQKVRYSFGVSRDDMKKVYVDEILKKGRDSLTPGPDKYPMHDGFGPKS